MNFFKNHIPPLPSRKNFLKFFLAKTSNGVKRYQTDIILVVGVILISLLSFAAGYITARYQEKTPLQFQDSQL